MESAISPKRHEDYPEWYQQVIRAADLAEVSPVRGCMVIKPWGYGIWENMQRILDRRFKETGHENAYFPIFIPLSFLEKEAAHVEGFAKECAVVTHHRLEMKDGKLIPTSELEEPLIVRPTSETIIGDSFAKWIRSYRDLPLLINQWANVVRWEMRTRLFLRTAEFLWQEGHTAHATEEDAREETLKILNIYQSFMQDVLALPVITGKKPDHERFPGAVDSYTCEAMMQDRKALQAGTSHYLGQNFAKASGIQFASEAGTQEYVHTTSWGVSTRMIGGVIMQHGDDDGLRLPPRVAPKHVVILPVIPKAESEAKVLEYAAKVEAALHGVSYAGDPLVSFVDRRDIRGGEKNWQWIKKGIPLRVEVGPRDADKNAAVIYRRDKGIKEKIEVSLEAMPELLPKLLTEIQATLYEQAQNHLATNLRTDINNFADFKAYFTAKQAAKPEIHGGFVRAKWSEDPASTALLDDLKVTVRCLPLDQTGSEGKCVLTGKPATTEAIFAKAY
ncbi:proline--tRNA ligase [bacterium]|nr:proline--tRNA ligase [bacterium]